MRTVPERFKDCVYDAWLMSAGIPADIIRSLLRRYGDPVLVYRNCGKDEALSGIVSERTLSLLRENGTEDWMLRTQTVMERFGISALRESDTEYPGTLRDINDPPAILFYRGNLQCLNNRTVAMVGSRAASYEGQKAARKLAHDLGRNGVSVISGLANGIDAAAHWGCIEGNSPTIAVVGCGPDINYPADNQRLRDEILKKDGLILSEYGPGEKAYGWHFPVRNRIITGLSRALILIEAKIRSGSMTSVQHALDQGKDVFVYPGDPSSDKYEGNRQLLREGGIYFTSADDILEDLDWLDNPPAVMQNSECSQGDRHASEEENSVIEALRPGPLGFEQLLSVTAMEPSKLLSTLTILQIKGRIEAMPGKRYILKQ